MTAVDSSNGADAGEDIHGASQGQVIAAIARLTCEAEHPNRRAAFAKLWAWATAKNSSIPDQEFM